LTIHGRRRTPTPSCRDLSLATDRRCAPAKFGPVSRSLDKLLHLLATGQGVSLAGE
jgi:hypothetical protein